VVARIDETVKEYSRQFDTLMFMLKEQVSDVLFATLILIIWRIGQILRPLSLHF
jgi:hypothetical protein